MEDLHAARLRAILGGNIVDRVYETDMQAWSEKQAARRMACRKDRLQPPVYFLNQSRMAVKAPPRLLEQTFSHCAQVRHPSEGHAGGEA